MQLYRGTGRSADAEAICANDMEAIFCTTSPETARYYAEWGGEQGHVLTVALDDAASIADMTDPAVVRRVICALRDDATAAAQWQGEDLDDERHFEALIGEIVEIADGLNHGALMDDPGMAAIVCDLGYDGARLWQRDGAQTYVIYNPDVLMTVAIDVEVA